MSNDPKELLEFAIKLAYGAGEIVKQGAEDNRFTISTKSTVTDPVTEVDKASERYIVEHILAERPGDGILGEEGASVASSNGTEWIIDPIDGTVNFIYGIPSYAVSIGVVVDGEPVAGAVYNVALDEMFTACLNGGAFLNGVPIFVNKTTDLGVSLVSTGFAYAAETRKEQGEVVGRLMPHVRDFRRFGSASLDICSVACGRIDAYYESRVSPWDVTGGAVILTEAGGKITGFDGDIPRTNAIATCSPEVYDALYAHVVPA